MNKQDYLSRREERFLDPFFNSFFSPLDGSVSKSLMKTDIVEKEDHYEMDVELPSVKKEDITLSIEDGYLTINATSKRVDKEENKGKVIRNERFYGSYTRSYYVGEDVKEKDISAKLVDG